MKTTEIYTALTENTTVNNNSIYYTENNVLVRISNHLPNTTNFKNLNENNDKIMLIFTDCELTENEIQKFIEKEMTFCECRYYILENKIDETDILLINHNINNF